MKLIKSGNLIKLVAFFVIATVLTCTVAFAAGGWQSFVEPEPDSDDARGENDQSGNVDENTDGAGEEVVQPPPASEFTHYLTGLTVTEAESARRPLAFVYSSGTPTYALSHSLLTVEMPTENGQTRLTAFISGSDYLGKIGSIAPTRDYISQVALSLGGSLIHHGNDDSFSYGNGGYGGIDLTVHTGYSYTEYTELNYSNGDLISALIKNTGENTYKSENATAPYVFLPKGESPVKGERAASTVMLPYSDGNSTEFIFDTATGSYTLHKNGTALKDLLNDRTCTYTNVFVLYANSTTYETAEATETIIDVDGGGSGIYFTAGTAIEISWRYEAGRLIFLDANGAKLTVNRGTAYVAFEKASRTGYTVYN